MRTTTRPPHGVEGQLNIYVLDRESSLTNFGRHARAIVFRDVASGRISIRVDRTDCDAGLPEPSLIDLLKVAQRPEYRLHPPGTSLAHVESVMASTPRVPGVRASTWHEFEIVPKRAAPRRSLKQDRDQYSLFH
jgi:hypothetical protein